MWRLRVRVLGAVVLVQVILHLDPPLLAVAAGSLALRTARLRETVLTLWLLLPL